MIELIGMRRVVTFLILLAVNAALGAAVYMYFEPQNLKAESHLRSVRAQVAQKNSEVEQMRQEFSAIEELKGRFAALKAAGFFNDQGRILAQKTMDEIQQKSRVQEVKYKFDRAEVSENSEVSDAGYVTLDSRVTVDIQAIDDFDIYKFVYWIENAFPGCTSIDSLTINRQMDVNQATLRHIGAGKRLALVKGTVVFSWKTLASKEQVQGAAFDKGGR